ncbi:MAG: LptF/LptG family permease [Candidatus Gygaella obscura]|nr:LptF/LptG family permease [Candidatus Gygaella obscura]
MRILDRYITKSLIFSFLSCIIVFIGLYVIIDIFTHLDDFLEQKVEFILFIKYYLSFLPTIFIQVSSYCIFLATIFTLNRLNRDNELIAIRASGQTIWQVTRNIIMTGVVLSFMIFMVNEKILPVTQGMHEEISNRLEPARRNQTNKIIQHLTCYGNNNRLIYANSFNVNENTLEQINILEHDSKQNVISKVVAQKAVYSGGEWIFYKVLVYDFFSDGEPKHEPFYFEEKAINIVEKPKVLLQQRQRLELMNTTQLGRYIERISKSGAKQAVRNLKVDFYNRFASSFSGVILIMLAISFAFTTKKRSSSIISFGVFVSLSFVYYLCSVLGIAFGKEGMLIPFLAVWLTPMIFLGLSIYFIQVLP